MQVAVIVMAIRINDALSIGEDEVTLSPIRAQGPGGQNVNKVSSAIHLRFDIAASSLPEYIKARLLNIRDRRVTADGVVVIKAQNHRAREKNRSDALDRLCSLIDEASKKPKKRIPTRPGKAAKKKRLDEKKKRGALKKLRSGPLD